MESNRITRRHLKPEERLRMVELFQSSDLSKSEFAKRHHTSVSSLERWLAEARKPCKKIPEVLFQEFTLSPSPAEPLSAGWAVEVVGPDGTTVRCRERLSTADLVRLLRGRTC